MRYEKPVPVVLTDALAPAIEAIQARISRKAFQYFTDRGAVDGHDLEDWLLAESELMRSPVIAVNAADEKTTYDVQLTEVHADALTLTVSPAEMLISCDSENGEPQISCVIRFDAAIDLATIDAVWVEGSIRIVTTALSARDRYSHLRTSVA